MNKSTDMKMFFFCDSWICLYEIQANDQDTCIFQDNREALKYTTFTLCEKLPPGCCFFYIVKFTFVSVENKSFPLLLSG